MVTCYAKTMTLKGHSQPWDCADLDTSFLIFEKSLPQPEIKVHLEFCFNLRSGLLDFQSFSEKFVWLKTLWVVSLLMLYGN